MKGSCKKCEALLVVLSLWPTLSWLLAEIAPTMSCGALPEEAMLPEARGARPARARAAPLAATPGGRLRAPAAVRWGRGAAEAQTRPGGPPGGAGARSCA